MPLKSNIQQIFIIGKAIENYPIWILFSHSNLKTVMELDLAKTSFENLNLFLDWSVVLSAVFDHKILNLLKFTSAVFCSFSCNTNGIRKGFQFSFSDLDGVEDLSVRPSPY